MIWTQTAKWRNWKKYSCFEFFVRSCFCMFREHLYHLVLYIYTCFIHREMDACICVTSHSDAAARSYIRCDDKQENSNGGRTKTKKKKLNENIAMAWHIIHNYEKTFQWLLGLLLLPVVGVDVRWSVCGFIVYVWTRFFSLSHFPSNRCSRFVNACERKVESSIFSTSKSVGLQFSFSANAAFITKTHTSHSGAALNTWTPQYLTNGKIFFVAWCESKWTNEWRLGKTNWREAWMAHSSCLVIANRTIDPQSFSHSVVCNLFAYTLRIEIIMAHHMWRACKRQERTPHWVSCRFSVFIVIIVCRLTFARLFYFTCASELMVSISIFTAFLFFSFVASRNHDDLATNWNK